MSKRGLTPLERLKRWLCPVHGTGLTQDNNNECSDIGKCPRNDCSFWIPSRLLRELGAESPPPPPRQ